MTPHILTSDHGKIVSVEDGGGTQGESIHGRPTGLMTASRDSAGAWEEIRIVESDERDIYGLQSVHGKFACCENEGKDGIIVFNRDGITAWEKFRVHNAESGRKLAFESVCRPKYFIKALGDGSVKLEQSFYEGKPVDKPGGYETFVCDPPFSLGKGGQPKNVITGQLRISDGYADNNGPYLPIGIHMGDLFSKYTRDEQSVIDALSKIRDAGYGLVQFWLNLGSLGGDYWAGREIGPEITPNYWGQLTRFSDVLDSFGIKGIYCTGDYALRGMSHKDFAAQVGNLLHNRDTAALMIAGNEAWQTGAESIDTLQDFIDAFKRACPDVPITTTSPPTENKDDIANWCDGDYYNIHGFRDGEDHDRIRHIFSVPWEGEPPCGEGYQDEPTGPGDEVSVKAFHCYEGRDVDASHLFALAAQSLITNQGYNFFCGDGVKLEGDIARWPGFKEVASVVNYIPKDVMSWDAPFHFGSSQAQRIFEPISGKDVRMDCRTGPGGQFIGVLYGDEGDFSIRNVRACHILLRNYDGSVALEADFHPGQELREHFVRSQGGQPGRTSFLVEGRLS